MPQVGRSRGRVFCLASSLVAVALVVLLMGLRNARHAIDEGAAAVGVPFRSQTTIRGERVLATLPRMVAWFALWIAVGVHLVTGLQWEAVGSIAASVLVLGGGGALVLGFWQILGVKLTLPASGPLRALPRTPRTATTGVKTGDRLLDEAVVLHGDRHVILGLLDGDSRRRLREAIASGATIDTSGIVWATAAGGGDLEGRAYDLAKLAQQLGTISYVAEALTTRAFFDDDDQVRLMALDALIDLEPRHPQLDALIGDRPPASLLSEPGPAALVALARLAEEGDLQILADVRALRDHPSPAFVRRVAACEAQVQARFGGEAAGLLSVMDDLGGGLTEAEARSGALSRVDREP